MGPFGGGSASSEPLIFQELVFETRLVERNGTFVLLLSARFGILAVAFLGLGALILELAAFLRFKANFRLLPFCLELTELGRLALEGAIMAGLIAHIQFEVFAGVRIVGLVIEGFDTKILTLHGTIGAHERFHHFVEELEFGVGTRLEIIGEFLE